MKPLITLSLAVAASLSCTAQTDSLIRPPVRILALPEAINTVLGDFPYNLQHLTGELVLAEAEADNYVSLIAIAEAEKCQVTRYHSVEDSTVSWQARVMAGNEFAAAAKRYRQLFGLLQTCYVRLPDSTIYFLSGNWEPARETVGFTTSTLRLRTDDQRFRNVEVMLELVYQVTDWVININIVIKRDDDATGMAGGGG